MNTPKLFIHEYIKILHVTKPRRSSFKINQVIHKKQVGYPPIKSDYFILNLQATINRWIPLYLQQSSPTLNK